MLKRDTPSILSGAFDDLTAHGLAGVEEVVAFQAGDFFDGSEEDEKNDHHDGEEGDADDNKTHPSERADAADKCFAAGFFAAEQMHGKEKVGDGGADEAESHAAGGAEQGMVELGLAGADGEGFVQGAEVDQLGLHQQGVDHRLFPAVAEGEGDGDHDGDGAFLDGEPEGVEFEESESTAEQNGEEAENGKKVPAHFFVEAPKAEADGKEQGDDQRPERSDAGGFAQLIERHGGQRDGKKDFEKGVGRGFGGGFRHGKEIGNEKGGQLNHSCARLQVKTA